MWTYLRANSHDLVIHSRDLGRVEPWQFTHRFYASEKLQEREEARNHRILDEEAESRKTRGMFLRREALSCVEASLCISLAVTLENLL